MLRKTRKIVVLLLTLVMVFSMSFTTTSFAVQPSDTASLPVYTQTDTMSTLYDEVVNQKYKAPSSGYYSISTADELYLLASYVNAGNAAEGLTFYLTADIKLGGETKPWTPIGQAYCPDNGVALNASQTHTFKGNFDGVGHKITNLYIGGTEYSGGSGKRNEANALFGLNYGNISNVSVYVNINTYRCGAGIAGHNYGTITACYSEGTIEANGGGGTRGTGGIAGENTGTVESCISKANIHNAYRRAGGIVGYNVGGTVSNCIFKGYTYSSNVTYSGGAAATNEGGTVINSYFLENSCADNALGWNKSGNDATSFGADKTFSVYGKITGTNDSLYTLLSEKSIYFKNISDRAPVLYFQSAADDRAKFSVTVKEPDAGEGSIEVYNGEEKVEGTVTLEENTVLTIKIGKPADGYWLKGFTENGSVVTRADGRKDTEGNRQIYDGMQVSYNVKKNAELSAEYVGSDDVALKINAQVGTTGKITPIADITWKDLNKYTENGKVAYMFQKEDTWRMVAVSKFVRVSMIFEYILGILPADDDYIVAVDDLGSSPNEKGAIPTFSFVYNDQEDGYFYGGVRKDNLYAVNDDAQEQSAPAVIALEYESGNLGYQTREDENLWDALYNLLDNSVYFSGNLRFCTGISKSDFEGCREDSNYMKSADYKGSFSGNRLWGNVQSLTVRTPEENAVLNLNADKLSMFQIEAHKTSKELKVTEDSAQTTRTYTGITVADLLKYYGEDCIAVEALNGDQSQKLYNKDHDWNNIMIAYSSKDSSGKELISDGKLHFVAANADSAVLSESVIDTLKTEKAAVTVDSKTYSLNDLKEYETTKTFTRTTKSGTSEYTVTGITAKDIIEKLSDNSSVAKVTFTSSDGYTAAVSNSDYSWSDDVMLAWSIKDNSGTEQLEEGTLRSAVNGSAGKLWASGVTNITTEAGVLTYNDISYSLEELQKYPTTKDMSMMKKGTEVKYSVTGITVEDLELMYGKGKLLKDVTFASADGFTSTADCADYSLDKMIIAWSVKDSSQNETLGEKELRSTVDGGAGKMWVSGLAKVSSNAETEDGALITKPINIKPTPSDSTVEVRKGNSQGETVKKSEDGSYPIILGETYYYKVSKSGYTAKAGTFIPVYLDEDTDDTTVAFGTPILVSLNASSSGSGGGGTSQRTDNEKIMFSVYLQNGNDGTPKLIKEFSESEIEAILTTGIFPYLYAKNEGWNAIVATELVTLDDLFEEAGIKNYWESGSYLVFNCSDGPYAKSYPTYEDIQTMRYYFDAEGTATVVPAGVAITWNSGRVGDTDEALTEENINALGSKAYRSTNYRLVFGVSESQFKKEGGVAPAGSRSPSQIISMTLVYDGEAPEGTQGVEHKTDDGTDVTPNPEDTTSGGTPFTDISSHWGKDAVAYVYKNNIMNGVSDTLFNPNGTLNRAMLATILYRDAGSPKTDSKSAFTDVTYGSWYYDAVCWASENGIVKGISQDRFAPANSITREQIAAMLYRYAKFKNYDVSASVDLSKYADSDQVSNYALDALKWANAEGFITGRTETTLAARGEATRAEMATIIERFNKKFAPAESEDAAQGENGDAAQGESKDAAAKS